FQASRYSRATSAGLVIGLLLSVLKAPVNAEIITPASTEVTDPGNSIHPEGVGGSPVVVTVIVIVGEGVEAGHALDLEDGTVPGVIRVDIGRGHPATPWHEGGGASEENPWVAGITVLLTAVQRTVTLCGVRPTRSAGVQADQPGYDPSPIGRYH